MAEDRTWFRLLKRADDGPILFALPPAGAGPNVFRPWIPHVPPHLELVAVNAPGREDRAREAPFLTAEPLAERLTEAILSFGRPFAIVGHSMGGLLGREVAARMKSPMFRLLVVAGVPAPHRPMRNLALASDRELLQALNEMGGTPDVVLWDSAVYSMYLPCLRADFSVAQSCRRPLTPSEVIDVPILALAGSDDRTAPASECAHWSVWTRRAFTIRVFRGGHFFPFTAAPDVLQLISAHVTRALPGTAFVASRAPAAPDPDLT